MNIVKKADCLHDQMEWGSLTWYAHTKLANSAAMTVGKCVIKPGCENSRHHHPNCEEVLHVLQGCISHSYEDTSVVLNEGDTITIQSGVVHHAINLGDVDAVLLISFSSPDRQTISARR